jgi:outer membrane scaffolding protein for murein synthesis (MipA/OmpV family)
MLRIVRTGLRRLGAALPVAVLMSSASLAQPAATDQPKWEAGLALGGGWVNDYPGADQNHARGIVTPLLIYRGSVLRIDREGVRGRLFKDSDFELDVAGSAWFDAPDSRAREGMPALDYLFGLGPQLVYKGLRQHWGSPTLHLKARSLVSTDFRKVHGRGVAFDPELRWHLGALAGERTTLTLGIQPTWASRHLMRYFYEVEPAQATPERPAYRARAGYLGTELNLLLIRRESATLSWFATARGMLLQGAANAASPLLRDKTTLSIGAGVLWTPWQSESRAAD